MPLLETLLFTLSKNVDFFPVLTMLALLIDYLVECVFNCVLYCLYHYTVQNKVILDMVFCSKYQNTCQLKVPFNCFRYLPVHFYHF